MAKAPHIFLRVEVVFRDLQERNLNRDVSTKYTQLALKFGASGAR